MSRRPRASRQQLEKSVAREYAALVRAVHALERSLASAAPTRERAWRQRARRDLANVIGYLQEHCQSAESVDGLLVEIERRVGRTHDLNEARREHERLSRDATGLLGAIDEHAKDGLSHHEVRRRAWDLTASLRRHQAREADLLIEALQRDAAALD